MMLELTGTKLSSQFNSKFNISNKQYKHDLVYFSRCQSRTYTDSYIEEAARHLIERIVDQYSIFHVNFFAIFRLYV